ESWGDRLRASAPPANAKRITKVVGTAYRAMKPALIESDAIAGGRASIGQFSGRGVKSSLSNSINGWCRQRFLRRARKSCSGEQAKWAGDLSASCKPYQRSTGGRAVGTSQ